MPYRSPAPELVDAKRRLIDELAAKEPIAGDRAAAELRWCVGAGVNRVTAAYMACAPTGPVARGDLDHLADVVLRHAAKTLAAVRGVTAQPSSPLISPTLGRLVGGTTIFDQFLASQQSQNYQETLQGEHRDTVLLEQFVSPITSASAGLGTGGEVAPERLYELAMKSVGAAADLLAVLEERPEYLATS